jgi:hypothetical protein
LKSRLTLIFSTRSGTTHATPPPHTLKNVFRENSWEACRVDLASRCPINCTLSATA